MCMISCRLSLQTVVRLTAALAILSFATWQSLTAPAMAAETVPPQVKMPGSQPEDQVSQLQTANRCDNCHGGYDAAVEPAFNWKGSVMAHAAGDPLFWATVAIAEQDFDGAGDLCLRCHNPAGWLGGRSTPTDGINCCSLQVTGAVRDGAAARFRTGPARR